MGIKDVWNMYMYIMSNVHEQKARVHNKKISLHRNTFVGQCSIAQCLPYLDLVVPVLANFNEQT